MPKLILRTLVGYLGDKKFDYFKGQWQAHEDDKITYEFDLQTSLLIEIYSIASFFISFVSFINEVLQCELKVEFIANASSTLDFKFKIKEEDENKGRTWSYVDILDYITRYIDKIIQKIRAAKIAAEFVDKFIIETDLSHVTIYLPANLIELITQDSSIKMRMLGWIIEEHKDNDDIEIILPKKSRLVENFLQKIDVGLKKLFSGPLDLEDDLPESFCMHEEDKLILKFQDLKLFTDKYPKFTIYDCLRGNLKVERSKPPANLYKSISSPETSPTVKDQEIINVDRERSYSEPVEIKKNKKGISFLGKFNIFQKKTRRPQSDEGVHLSQPYISNSQYFPKMPKVKEEIPKENMENNELKKPKLAKTQKFRHFPPFKVQSSISNKENLEPKISSQAQEVQVNEEPIFENLSFPEIKPQFTEKHDFEKDQVDGSNSEEDFSITGCPSSLP